MGYLSPATQRLYYQTFLGVLKAARIDLQGWPKAPRVPNIKRRDPLEEDDLQNVLNWLRGRKWHRTAALGYLLRHTGMRADKEALHSALHISRITPAEGKPYVLLEIDKGKGDDYRAVPVTDPTAASILANSEVMHHIRQTPYSTHRQRWKMAVDTLGIKSKLPTLHSLRHAYATDCYRKTGDLTAVQHLLGHKDVNTTTRYLAVRTHQDLADALSATIQAIA
jgi:integrase